VSTGRRRPARRGGRDGGAVGVRALAEKLIDRVIEFGIGGGPLTGAVPVADEHLLAAAATLRAANPSSRSGPAPCPAPPV
jgi:hypothetical protein